MPQRKLRSFRSVTKSSKNKRRAWTSSELRELKARARKKQWALSSSELRALKAMARKKQWALSSSDLRALKAMARKKQWALSSSDLRALKARKKMTVSGYSVVGTTTDGVRILRAKIKPTHFTSSQIRKTISEVESGLTN
jgi:hypothetical protein